MSACFQCKVKCWRLRYTKSEDEIVEGITTRKVKAKVVKEVLMGRVRSEGGDNAILKGKSVGYHLGSQRMDARFSG